MSTEGINVSFSRTEGSTLISRRSKWRSDKRIHDRIRSWRHEGASTCDCDIGCKTTSSAVITRTPQHPTFARASPDARWTPAHGSALIDCGWTMMHDINVVDKASGCYCLHLLWLWCLLRCWRARATRGSHLEPTLLTRSRLLHRSCSPSTAARNILYPPQLFLFAPNLPLTPSMPPFNFLRPGSPSGTPAVGVNMGSPSRVPYTCRPYTTPTHVSLDEHN